MRTKWRRFFIYTIYLILGPFLILDADYVKSEVDDMWQTLYKLAKILYDIPGAKRVAEMIRAKVEKFRQYMPLLQVICNKGLQERHWQQVIWDIAFIPF
jgi:dynein heavy chain